MHTHPSAQCFCSGYLAHSHRIIIKTSNAYRAHTSQLCVLHRTRIAHRQMFPTQFRHRRTKHVPERMCIVEISSSHRCVCDFRRMHTDWIMCATAAMQLYWGVLRHIAFKQHRIVCVDEHACGLYIIHRIMVCISEHRCPCSTIPISSLYYTIGSCFIHVRVQLVIVSMHLLTIQPLYDNKSHLIYTQKWHALSRKSVITIFREHTSAHTFHYADKADDIVTPVPFNASGMSTTWRLYNSPPHSQLQNAQPTFDVRCLPSHFNTRYESFQLSWFVRINLTLRCTASHSSHCIWLIFFYVEPLVGNLYSNSLLVVFLSWKRQADIRWKSIARARVFVSVPINVFECIRKPSSLSISLSLFLVSRCELKKYVISFHLNMTSILF